jgi:uncharacterized metal-binding protein YceD (DUF177 family)
VTAQSWTKPAWTKPVRLHELDHGPVTYSLVPDAEQRAAIARQVGLESLPELTAELTLKPWMDGVEITGRFRATVGQICSVSLDPFEQSLRGEIDVRAVPAGSPQAPDMESREIDHDPDAPEPPDVLDGDAVDLAGYVVEHLALEIDPFARKPGVEFEYVPDPEPESPFAVLKKLKDSEP